MAHAARVLPGEKTIRMHYANCNTYNADFDGDEMNMHLPQNPLAQAEARLIMNNDHQYLVPTNGEPLRGLIQDHVVTGVMLCCRDTFLTKEEYSNLLYTCLVDHVKGRIRTLPPALCKPQQLWTGKQVISTLMLNLTLGQKQMNLDSKSQVPSKSWSVMQKVGTEEGDVIFRDGQLLTGVLDKKQFGAKAKGMVHAVYEIYGAETAGKLLTALGRLFTKYVQMVGFSCRMEDLVLSVSISMVWVMNVLQCQCVSRSVY
jgi:DNA-directed RNA polymerase I subunit RPA1